MSHFNQTLSLPTAITPRSALWSQIVTCLQRCWAAECHRAERPARFVPYY